MSSYRFAPVRVLRLRVKDKHTVWLCGLAREVNTVFNYCNELSVKVFERERRFLSGFDRSVPSLGIDLGLKTFAAFSRDRSRSIHAKIANRRKDFLHKLSTRLVKANGALFVGNVNASALAKNEAFSTQTCSVCECRAGPKGR